MAKVMVVDGSAAMRQMIAFTLSAVGHEVLDAVDIRSALTCVHTQKAIDLIITELDLAGDDGLELIRALRALPALKSTPILILTAETSAEKKAAGRAAGATGWIVKPFQPEQLTGTINKVL